MVHAIGLMGLVTNITLASLVTGLNERVVILGGLDIGRKSRNSYLQIGLAHTAIVSIQSVTFMIWKMGVARLNVGK